MVLFNEGKFYQCHELWEAVWIRTEGSDKNFYKGLIQAAVALYHYLNDNLVGAENLCRTSMRYLEPYGDRHQGVNLAQLSGKMERCFHNLLSGEELGRRLNPLLIPRIEHDPHREGEDAP